MAQFYFVKENPFKKFQSTWGDERNEIEIKIIREPLLILSCVGKILMLIIEI